MKIVRIIARLNVGGPAIHVSLVSSELAKKGHHGLLLAGDVEPGEGDMSYLAHELQVPLLRIPTLGRRISPWRDLRAMLNILRAIRREKPDVVHTHTAKAGTLGRIAAAMAGVPCVVHTFHGHVLEGYFSPTKTAVFRQIERMLARFTDRVISITPQQKQDLIEHQRIASPEKVEIIRLGFDLDPWMEVAQNRRSAAERLQKGAWVGRLTAIKDPMLLLETAALVPGCDFSIVGGGEMEAQVKAEISRRQLKNVDMAGWMRDMRAVYGPADFVVLTSINEGTPVALIEAMATGLPIVALEAGGVTDLMLGPARSENGFDVFQNGLLVRVRRADHLANAITWLAERPDLGRSMGVAGRAFVAKTYSKERLIRELEDLYIKVLQQKKRFR